MESKYAANAGGWGEQDQSIGPLRHLRVAVEGMTCESCVSDVEYALLTVRGVFSAEANLVAGTVDVSCEEVYVSLAALRKAIQAAGYRFRIMPIACEMKEEGFALQRFFRRLK